MTAALGPVDWTATILCAILGLALGLAFFAALEVNLRLYLGGGRAAAAGLLHTLRLGVAGAGFWAAAQWGALPLLVALLGFLAARFLARKRLEARP